ncbi:hypothetical protein NXT3_CH03279 [Sinorhizobium fredii]|uniref:Uncharacterized protein n=1 Tax=Rhizobium fredii TaxID=380 RepID=A0A2L0H8L1_RHIFR|nr:hypothetical protein NXT3_CH03279 [Sinorhizobium fredii]
MPVSASVRTCGVVAPLPERGASSLVGISTPPAVPDRSFTVLLWPHLGTCFADPVPDAFGQAVPVLAGGFRTLLKRNPSTLREGIAGLWREELAEGLPLQVIDCLRVVGLLLVIQARYVLRAQFLHGRKGVFCVGEALALRSLCVEDGLVLG